MQPPMLGAECREPLVVKRARSRRRVVPYRGTPLTMNTSSIHTVSAPVFTLPSLS